MEKPRIDLLACAEASPRGRLVERPEASDDDPSESFFRSAQWSADGTTLIASSSSNAINTFALPADLLEPREGHLSLSPAFALTLPEPTHVLASSPYFNLSTPYTQTSLVACRDHPIQLYSTPASPPPDRPASSSISAKSGLSSSTDSSSRPPPLASYPLIRPQTEAYLTPTALLWSTPGTHFTAGTANLIATFDISRPGAGPVSRIHTIPSKRHISKGSGVGMRGTVAALAVQPSSTESTTSGLVAAGTWTRWIGLYDLSRAGEAVANWSIAGAAPEDEGRGVVQTLWSPCGRYLIVNERKATGLLVYDVRVTGKLLAWLEGRSGSTHQRLSCDVFAGAGDDGSFEVWGGTDRGEVVVWDSVGRADDAVSGSWKWNAGGSAPMGSVAMHGSGSVVATCSGGWIISNYDTDEESDDDLATQSGGSRGRDVSNGVELGQGARLAVWSIDASQSAQGAKLDHDQELASEPLIEK